MLARIPEGPHRRRAVVIGGSVAGLLSAAAVAGHVDEVIVVDRDRLPRGATWRDGVPHARHSHVMLTPGYDALEALMPGVITELACAGAAYGPSSTAVRFHSGGGALDFTSSQMPVLAIGREVLEEVLRRRVTALPGVELRERTSVLDLRIEGGDRIVGVRTSHADDGHVEDLDTDLVIDASGRTSHIVDTLVGHGIPAPPTDKVRVDGWYVTRRFILPPGREIPPALAGVTLIVQTTPGVLTRTAVMVRVAERAWSVSMSGYRGERSPADLDGFRAHAAGLPGPIPHLLTGLEPDGTAVTYRLPALVRRRFESLSAPPRGLIVVGDARCTVDAAGGTGMSLAAAEAYAVRVALESVPLEHVPYEVYRRTSRIIDHAWAGAMHRHVPQTSFPGRLADAYARRVLSSAEHDPVLGLAFARLAQLQEGPETLLAPRILARALRPKWVAGPRGSGRYPPVSGKTPGGRGGPPPDLPADPAGLRAAAYQP